MEPICINGWGIEPLAGYLEKHANYATGSVPCLFSMRLLPGSERTGWNTKKHVTPDLSLFGKSIGNGIPITVLVGKRSIMSLYEKRQLVHGGTFNGHVLGLAAILIDLFLLSPTATGLYRLRRKGGKASAKPLFYMPPTNAI